MAIFFLRLSTPHGSFTHPGVLHSPSFYTETLPQTGYRHGYSDSGWGLWRTRLGGPGSSDVENVGTEQEDFTGTLGGRNSGGSPQMQLDPRSLFPGEPNTPFWKSTALFQPQEQGAEKQGHEVRGERAICTLYFRTKKIHRRQNPDHR